MAVESKHCANFVATRAASPITTVRDHLRTRLKSLVRGAVRSCRDVRIRKAAAQPAAQDFFAPNSAVASIHRLPQPCPRSNGGVLHRFHLPSFAKKCRNSTLSRAWSTPGYPRSPKKCVSAVLSPMLIRCVWILGWMKGRQTISSQLMSF